MKKRNPLRLLSVIVGLFLSLAMTLNTLAQEPTPNSPASPESPSAAGALDPTFGGFGGNGRVNISGMVTRAMALQPDGKIVVIGIDQGDLIVHRYRANGVPDAGFGNNGIFRINLGQGAPCNFEIECGVALQADGKIVVAADSDMGGDEDFAVVRLTVNGQLDQSFGAGGLVLTDFSGENDSASDIAIQADGKIVVAGTAVIPEIVDDDVFATARYHPDGSLDVSFSGDGKVTTNFDETSHGFANHSSTSVAIQQDGKIIVAGRSDNYYGIPEKWATEFGFVRYNPDGSRDNSFSGDGLRTIGFADNDAESWANALVIQPDGRILAVGWSQEFGWSGAIENYQALVRLNPNGDLDSNFDGDGKRLINIDNIGGDYKESIMAVDLQPDGKIVTAGFSSEGRIVLMRLLYNGELDTSFVGNGILDWFSGIGLDMAIQPDGKIIVLHNAGMMRFILDGNFDQAGKTATDFGNGNERAWAATVAPNGKIILAGEATPRSSSRKYMALARYNPDGTSDNSFDGNGRATATFTGDDGANDVLVHPDGSILAAGFTRRTDYDFALYRFASNGSISESSMYNIHFGYGDDFAQEVLLQPDGKIVLAGFAKYPANNDPDRVVFAVARLNPDFGLDNSFGNGGKVLTPVGVGPSARARAAMLQPDGKILLVGYHDREFVVVRYNTNGALDAGFGQAGIVKVTGLPQPGGMTLDHPLDYANSVGLLRYGNIAVAGQGDNKFGLLILGPDGGHCTICGNLLDHYWLTFDISTGSIAAYDMFVQPDGKILLVGNRTLQNAGFYIARLRPKTGLIGSIPQGYELDPTFDQDGKRVVTVMAGGDYGRAVALYGSRMIFGGHSHNFHDFDFSLVVLENDVEYFPPDPSDEGKHHVFLPLLIR